MATPASRHPFPARLFIWLTILILLVAFSIWQIKLTAELQGRIDAWQVREEARSAASFAAERRADAVFLQIRLKRRQPTTRDAAQALNGGSPLPTTQEGSQQVLVYTDPATGGTAYLGFSGESWNSTSPVFLNPTRAGWPDPNKGPYAIVTVGRRLAYMLGYVIWLFVFAILMAGLCMNPWKRRTPLAIDLTMLAIVSTTLALTGPNPRRALFDWFQNDSAAWGMLEILISFGCLILATRKRERTGSKPPQCASCGYDLTANESGRCPECGTPVGALVA